MAFSFAVSGTAVLGNLRFKWGTFTNAAGDTGDAITTGLNAVFGFGFVPTSHIDTLNIKYSASGGIVTVDIEDGVDGNWWAIGV